jgi:hypothetical protein
MVVTSSAMFLTDLLLAEPLAFLFEGELSSTENILPRIINAITIIIAHIHQLIANSLFLAPNAALCGCFEAQR